MTEDHFRCSKRLVSKRNLTRFTALIFCRSSHSCKVDKYITETVTFNVQRPKTQRVIKPDVYFFFFFFFLGGGVGMGGGGGVLHVILSQTYVFFMCVCSTCHRMLLYIFARLHENL